MRKLVCGGVWTGPGSPPRGPSEIIIEAGRIRDMVPAGDSAPDTFVIPAFADAHCHFTWTGLESLCTDLRPTGSASDLLESVLEDADSDRTGLILRGAGFDDSAWDPPDLPALDELDRVSGRRPIILRRICGHCALVNSSMLEMIPSPSPGVDRTTGVIREGIVFDLERLFPPERSVIEEACRNAERAAHACGVTSVFTFESAATGDVLLSSGIRVRLSVCPFAEDFRESPNSDSVRKAKGVKFFLDGSFGARTAAVSASYSDGRVVHPLLATAEIEEAIEFASDRGLSAVFHAIGGRALSSLDMASAAIRGGRCRRPGVSVRVEHAEEIFERWPGSWDPEVHVFVMQPNFVARWQGSGGLYERMIGECRRLMLNPFRLLIDSGFRVGFGSDGMPFGPLAGLPGATDHPCPEQRIDTGAALNAYTLEAASICGLDDLAGPLGPGRTADLAVLSNDPFTVPWEDMEVVETIYEGDTVYSMDGVAD